MLILTRREVPKNDVIAWSRQCSDDGVARNSAVMIASRRTVQCSYDCVAQNSAVMIVSHSVLLLVFRTD